MLFAVPQPQHHVRGVFLRRVTTFGADGQRRRGKEVDKQRFSLPGHPCQQEGMSGLCPVCLTRHRVLCSLQQRSL